MFFPNVKCNYQNSIALINDLIFLSKFILKLVNLINNYAG